VKYVAVCYKQAEECDGGEERGDADNGGNAADAGVDHIAEEEASCELARGTSDDMPDSVPAVSAGTDAAAAPDEKQTSPVQFGTPKRFGVTLCASAYKLDVYFFGLRSK